SDSRIGKELASLVTSLALLILLENLAQIIWGSQGVQLGRFSYNLIELGGVTIMPLDILLIACTIILLALLAMVLKFSILGQSIQAAMDDPESAEVMGINLDRIAIWTT